MNNIRGRESGIRIREQDTEVSLKHLELYFGDVARNVIGDYFERDFVGFLCV